MIEIRYAFESASVSISIRAGQPPDPLLNIIRKIGALVKNFFEKVGQKYPVGDFISSCKIMSYETTGQNRSNLPCVFSLFALFCFVFFHLLDIIFVKLGEGG
mgnify:CR=1 FL=1